MGVSLVTLLPHSTISNILVSSFFSSNGGWDIPLCFKMVFPFLVRLIEDTKVVLSRLNELVWKFSSNGLLTSKDMYCHSLI